MARSVSGSQLCGLITAGQHARSDPSPVTSNTLRKWAKHVELIGDWARVLLNATASPWHTSLMRSLMRQLALQISTTL
jgi:hypothetical protein